MVKGTMPPPPPAAAGRAPTEHAVPPPTVEPPIAAPPPGDEAPNASPSTEKPPGNACIACEGTGKNSKGGPCPVCASADTTGDVASGAAGAADTSGDNGENTAPTAPDKGAKKKSGDAWDGLKKSDPEEGRKRRTAEQIRQDGLDSAELFLTREGYEVQAPEIKAEPEPADTVKAIVNRLRRLSAEIGDAAEVLNAAKLGLPADVVTNLLKEFQEKVAAV